MQVLTKVMNALKQIWTPKPDKQVAATTCPSIALKEAQDRIARLERNYIVLLKRVLEMDGVKLITTKASTMDSKILQTTSSEENNSKGLHEDKPTVH